MKSMRSAVAIGVSVSFVIGAFAADLPDYSSYARLKATTSVSGGCPAASAWDPASNVAEGGNYYIPERIELSNSNNTGKEAGSWPIDDLAIAGTFRLTVSGMRDYAPRDLKKVTLLPGGTLTINGAYGTLHAQELAVAGTAESPSVVEYVYNDTSDTLARYALIEGELTGPETAVVQFTRPDTAYWGFERATHLQAGMSRFYGRVIVSGSKMWLRPATTATNFDLGGTMELANGAGLYLSSISPTFGGLTIAAGTTLRLDKGASLTITRSLTVEEGAKINVPSLDFVVGPNPPRVKILTFATGNVSRPALTEWARFFETSGTAARFLSFEETSNPDGSVDLFVVQREAAQFKSNTGALNNPFYDPPDYSALSDYDKSADYRMSSEKVYLSNGRNIYFSNSTTFDGYALVLMGLTGKLAGYSGSTFTCDRLVLQGSRIQHQKAAHSIAFDGNIYSDGGLVRFSGPARIEIKSAIHGSADLGFYRVGTDSALIDGDTPEHKESGRVILSGDNSDFVGRFLFGTLDATNRVNGRLEFSQKENLGGTMPSFVPDALTVSNDCRLVYTGSADETIDELTRGWTLWNGTELEVRSACTLTALNKITLAGDTGSVVKIGPGTLAVADVDGGTLYVHEGSLCAVRADALVDLGTLGFAKGTALTVDCGVSDADLLAKGVDFSATTLELPEEGVAVSFANLPDVPATVAVATLASESDAAKFAFPKMKGLLVERSVVPAADGKLVLKAEFSKKGLAVIVK